MKPNIFLLLALWITVTSATVPGIDAYDHQRYPELDDNDTPVAIRMLGEARSIISGISLLQADRYFHGGVGHAEDHHSVMKGTDARSPEREREDLLCKISERLEVTEHEHLHGNQIKEIMPWLYYSIKIDPHNIQAITLAGFYLAERLGHVNEGITVLKKGLRDNPGSWEINADLGRIYFEDLKDYRSAIIFLSRAKDLIDRSPHDKFQERYVLSFLARSYEAVGEKGKALPLYERIERLFPGTPSLVKKIDQLADGEE